jgi:hypothetical protein
MSAGTGRKGSAPDLVRVRSADQRPIPGEMRASDI